MINTKSRSQKLENDDVRKVSICVPKPNKSLEKSVSSGDNFSQMNKTKMKLNNPSLLKSRRLVGKAYIVYIRMNDLQDIRKYLSKHRINKLIKKYNKLVGHCIQLFGGFHIQSNEDKNVLIFKKSWDAVNCAIAIAEGFRKHTWDEKVIVHSCNPNENVSDIVNLIHRQELQMGVVKGMMYAGELGSPEYFCPDVSSAVSVANIARGGQILVDVYVWNKSQQSMVLPCYSKLIGVQQIQYNDSFLNLIEIRPTYTEQDVQASAIPASCEYCNDQMAPGQSYEEALGRFWHTDHLRCNDCDCVLTGEYILDDGKPYCLTDFFMVRGYTCHGCESVVTSSYIEAANSYWHRECFVCQKCRQTLDQEQKIYELNALPYCLNCYQDVKDSISIGNKRSTKSFFQAHQSKSSDSFTTPISDSVCLSC